MCWGQRGREEEVAVVPELNRCVIKRSQGHIKRRTKSGGLYVSALEHGGGFFSFFFFTAMCLCVYVFPAAPQRRAGACSLSTAP